MTQQKELQEHLINQATDELTRQILYNHSMEEHSDSIIFYTQIIATELLFRRGAKHEVRQLISDIMPDNYNNFPYPPNISTVGCDGPAGRSPINTGLINRGYYTR